MQWSRHWRKQSENVGSVSQSTWKSTAQAALGTKDHLERAKLLQQLQEHEFPIYGVSDEVLPFLPLFLFFFSICVFFVFLSQLFFFFFFPLLLSLSLSLTLLPAQDEKVERFRL